MPEKEKVPTMKELNLLIDQLLEGLRAVPLTPSIADFTNKVLKIKQLLKARMPPD